MFLYCIYKGDIRPATEHDEHSGRKLGAVYPSIFRGKSAPINSGNDPEAANYTLIVKQTQGKLALKF
ncbi:MAG: hypothetical protein B7X54_01725 [Idiomarina sp. 34-48-12]|nr:MAG: hypothetical protein B7X54_01725 [Idiomarina sp. 34-48-12]